MAKQINSLWFGTNGTGKTTDMLDVANRFMDDKESLGLIKNQLVLIPDDSEKKYDNIPEGQISDLHGDFGIMKIICNVNLDKTDKKTKTVYETIYENYALRKRQMNCLIINDDMGGLMSRRPNDILLMLSRRRQMNIDCFWNFHGLTTDCPKQFFKTVTSLNLFMTTDDHRDTMDKIGRDKHQMFLDAYNEVQAIGSGKMLDIKGYVTFDEDKAYYNKEQLFDKYHKTEVELISID